MNDTRSAFTAGLRALADAIDKHDGIPLPVDGNLAPLSIAFMGDRPVQAMDAAAEILGCEWTPEFKDGSHGVLLALTGRLDGLRIRLIRYLTAEDTAELEAVAA